MENNQSVQHQPSQEKAAIAESRNSKSRQIGSWNVLIHLFAHYPWLLLVGLLAMFIGSATLAVYSLGNVGQIEREEAETLQAEVEVPQPIKVPAQTTNPTPLWMVAAIALSCASGCFIIFRLLNSTPRHQKVEKHINRHQARVSQRRKLRVETYPLKNPPVFVPPQPVKQTVAVPPQTTPMVTVLPPEQNLHLDKDKDKESLADMMDIRKQSSLSAILRKY
ncbi:MAG: hypothetical protein ACHBN1_22915 [Heteroscytonema crispum UTEX LB 1556]